MGPRFDWHCQEREVPTLCSYDVEQGFPYRPSRRRLRLSIQLGILEGSAGLDEALIGPVIVLEHPLQKSFNYRFAPPSFQACETKAREPPQSYTRAFQNGGTSSSLLSKTAAGQLRRLASFAPYSMSPDPRT